MTTTRSARTPLAAAALLLALGSAAHPQAPRGSARDGATAPADSGSAQARLGRAEFLEHNCYGCHGGLAGGGMGPSLRDSDWDHGASDDSILHSILQGHEHMGMPAWEEKGMRPDEARAILGYIRTLRTPAEPKFFFGWKQIVDAHERGEGGSEPDGERQRAVTAGSGARAGQAGAVRVRKASPR